LFIAPRFALFARHWMKYAHRSRADMEILAEATPGKLGANPD
jgi:hypothetical protein